MRCDMDRCCGVYRDRCERDKKGGQTIGCRNVKGTSRGVTHCWMFVLFLNVDVTESSSGVGERMGTVTLCLNQKESKCCWQ